MGKKDWFSAVKKVMRSSSLKKKIEKRSHRSKANPNKSCHGYQMSLDTCLSQTQAPLANPPHHYPPIENAVPKQPENEQQIKQASSIAYPITMEEEETNTTSHVSVEVKYITSHVDAEDTTCHDDAQDTSSHTVAADITSRVDVEVNCITTLREEIAVVRIQTACRGYLARKVMQHLRAQRRLKLLIQSQAVKCQIESTLIRLQTTEGEALKRQKLQRHKKDLPKLKSSEGTWDLSPKSKEQVEANLQKKREAAERREKALDYIYSHQKTWRASLKSSNSVPKARCSVSRLNSASSKRSTDNSSKSLSSMRSKRSLSASSSENNSYKGLTKKMKADSGIMHPGLGSSRPGKKGISIAGSRVGSVKMQFYP